MVIQWGRGLFRSWLLATVLWVGFAGWAEIDALNLWPSNAGAPPFEMTKPIDPTKFNTPVTDPVLLAQLNAPDHPQSKLIAVGTVLGPPLFVLIFGFALWWVIRGFKPREN